MRNASDKRQFGAFGGLVVMVWAVAVGLAACSGSGTASRAGNTSGAAPKAALASTPAAAPAPTTTAGSPSPAPTAAAAGDPAPAPAGNAAAAAPAPAPGVCAGVAFCYETGNFAATVTNFRTSVVSAYRIIDATVRFQNKTSKPLILGYVLASGIAVDEKGNRYAVGGPNGYRGIGFVNGQSVDPKFVVQPGSFADARFELSWAPGNAIVGSTFELDLTVSEINTLEGNQHTLGGEFPMTFRGLVNEAPAPARK